MMDDIEKTKPVDAAPADDGETGAGCDVCMPPIALVGADEYDYKYLCMPSMVRALRRNQLQRATRHRRDGLDGVGLTGLSPHSRGDGHPQGRIHVVGCRRVDDVRCASSLPCAAHNGSKKYYRYCICASAMTKDSALAAVRH